MEREIKFRGKRLDNGEWVKGALCRSSYGIECIQTYEDTEESEIIQYYPIDPSTVCQYTGLKDKDGKEIWEGDLLKSEYIDTLLEVRYFNGAFYTSIKGKVYADPLFIYVEEDVCLLKVVGSKFDKEV